jgi:hypothetical protein
MINKEFLRKFKSDPEFLIDMILKFQQQIKLDKELKKLYLRKIKSLESELEKYKLKEALNGNS